MLSSRNRERGLWLATQIRRLAVEPEAQAPAGQAQIADHLMDLARACDGVQSMQFRRIADGLLGFSRAAAWRPMNAAELIELAEAIEITVDYISFADLAAGGAA